MNHLASVVTGLIALTGVCLFICFAFWNPGALGGLVLVAIILWIIKNASEP